MSSRSYTTSLSTTVAILVIFLIRQSTGTSSSPELNSLPEKQYCPWDWTHVGNICMTTAPSSLRAFGGGDVNVFCGRRGAYFLTVDGYDLCVKYTKTASNDLPARPHRGLLDFVQPYVKRVMGNVGF